MDEKEITDRAQVQEAFVLKPVVIYQATSDDDDTPVPTIRYASSVIVSLQMERLREIYSNASDTR